MSWATGVGQNLGGRQAGIGHGQGLAALVMIASCLLELIRDMSQGRRSRSHGRNKRSENQRHDNAEHQTNVSEREAGYRESLSSQCRWVPRHFRVGNVAKNDCENGKDDSTTHPATHNPKDAEHHARHGKTRGLWREGGTGTTHNSIARDMNRTRSGSGRDDKRLIALWA